MQKSSDLPILMLKHLTYLPMALLLSKQKKLSVQQPTSFTPRMDFNSLFHGVSSMRLIQGYPFRALEMLVKSRMSLTLLILEPMKVGSQMIRFMTLPLERTRLGTLTTMWMCLLRQLSLVM